MALAEYTAVEARNLAPLPAGIDHTVACFLVKNRPKKCTSLIGTGLTIRTELRNLGAGRATMRAIPSHS